MLKTKTLNQSMTIMHVASGDVWAGAEIQLFYLAMALNKRSDINLYVVIFNKGVLYKKLSEEGVDVILLEEDILNSMNIFINLVKFINQNNVDVVHAHKLKEHILGGAASLLFNQVKYIRTIHGGAEYDTKLSVRHSILGTANYLIEKIATTRLIYVSSELQKRLVKQTDKRHMIVENGIDFNEIDKKLSDKKLDNSDGNLIKIVMIGRLVSVKRIDIFLEIAERFNDNQDIRFYIIGDGPLKSEIETTIIDRDLEKTVSMLGFLENPLPVLKQMDYMIITSDHEGLPMSLLEALYLKVLVISHDIGGIGEVVEKGSCGILIDSQDPVKYSESLKWIISNSKLYEDIVNRGFDRVISYFSSKENANKYCEIYKNVVTGNYQ
jgi:L-malate glycosyltransferase